MSKIDYDNRIFRGIENYEDGDLNAETRFHYHQSGVIAWGEVVGGRVSHGSFVATIRDDGSLDMRWHYISIDGHAVGGACISTPELLADGRLQVYESWQIYGGEAGKSVIEEIR